LGQTWVTWWRVTWGSRFLLGEFRLHFLNQQAQVAPRFMHHFLEFLQFPTPVMGIIPDFRLPEIEFGEPCPHDFANGHETRPQMSKVRSEFVPFDQLPSRFDALKTEVV
jgi:hypothetical protein